MTSMYQVKIHISIITAMYFMRESSRALEQNKMITIKDLQAFITILDT